MKSHDVFINCPFSDDYLTFFGAIVFTVVRSGFSPRCAREHDDGGEVRFEKICRIISDCAYGIHDISKTELDPDSGLPRFNMPFELGLFLGAARFGAPGTRTTRTPAERKTLIFDRAQYRYQTFLSDIAGQDIHSHDGDVAKLIGKVATWLRDHAGKPDVPGGRLIAEEFARFSAAVPKIAATKRLVPEEITFKDYWQMAAQWIMLDAAALSPG